MSGRSSGGVDEAASRRQCRLAACGYWGPSAAHPGLLGCCRGGSGGLGRLGRGKAGCSSGWAGCSGRAGTRTWPGTRQTVRTLQRDM